MKRNWTKGLKIAVFVVVVGFVVMSLWNWLMPSLFGVRLISFWQAPGTPCPQQDSLRRIPWPIFYVRAVGHDGALGTNDLRRTREVLRRHFEIAPAKLDRKRRTRSSSRSEL